MNRVFLACLWLLSVTSSWAAELSAVEPNAGNWPRWRGPADNGSAPAADLPTDWKEGQGLLWKVKMPGAGCSTPIVWQDQLLLTTPVAGQNGVLALDWSGKVLWQTQIGAERPGKHRNGSGSNPSPVTDGTAVYTYFKSGDLARVNLDGQRVWQHNLQERFAKDTLYWDIGTSPVLTEKAVVVAVMHSGESYLAAFNKTDGELLWKVARNYKTPVEGDHSYATPLVLQQNGLEVIVVWGGEHLTAHAAADGREIWSCGGFNPDRNGNWVAVASPVAVDDLIVVPYGRGSRLAGIRTGGTGDVTETHRVWTRTDTGNFVPSPAVAAGKVLLVRDAGEVELIDPKTGQTVWAERFPKHRNKYYASPLVVGDTVFAPREDGVVFVAKIGEKFALLAENNLGERIIASPVVVNEKLLIRGEQHLYYFGTTP